MSGSSEPRSLGGFESEGDYFRYLYKEAGVPFADAKARAREAALLRTVAQSWRTPNDIKGILRRLITGE